MQERIKKIAEAQRNLTVVWNAEISMSMYIIPVALTRSNALLNIMWMHLSEYFSIFVPSLFS